MASLKKSPASLSSVPVRVRRYDFKTVRKLKQIQRIRLGTIHSRLSATLAKRMETFLHCTVETSFLGLEQVMANAFQPADYGEVICATFSLGAGQGQVYTLWPRTIAFFVIERLLGSKGEHLFTDKMLSDFERRMLLRFGQELWLSLQSGFENGQAPQGECVKIMEGVEPFAEDMPYEILLLSRINVQAPYHQGKITMIYPYSQVRPWIDDQEEKNDSAQDNSWRTSASGMPSSLAKAPLLLTIKMDPTPIKVSDFTGLQVGDCIQLNHSIHDPFKILVENQVKYLGYLGTAGRQSAVKIAAKVNTSPSTATEQTGTTQAGTQQADAGQVQQQEGR